MVASAKVKIKAVAKDVLLAPIYLYQGHRVKRDTVRLLEPDGDRQGQIELNGSTQARSEPSQILNIMVVGDSAAAGVGSEDQQQALAGKLLVELPKQTVISNQFDVIEWSVQATTGHTSFDILRRLYILPKPNHPIDIMVLSVGVNDTTANVSVETWQRQVKEIIAIAKRKFGVKALIFSRLPRMAQMPALPKPLNDFVGAKALLLDEALQQICAEHDGVNYLATDFARMIAEHANGMPMDIAVMFAEDGFHPSSIMYGYWAQQLAELIAQLIMSDSLD